MDQLSIVLLIIGSIKLLLVQILNLIEYFVFLVFLLDWVGGNLTLFVGQWLFEEDLALGLSTAFFDEVLGTTDIVLFFDHIEGDQFSWASTSAPSLDVILLETDLGYAMWVRSEIDFWRIVIHIKILRFVLINRKYTTPRFDPRDWK